MLVGVPKEIKNNEFRVALTPAGVHELVTRGHEVLVQSSAGEGSGFRDDDYQKAGATIAATAEEIWSKAELLCKVKEPIAMEYPLMRKGPSALHVSSPSSFQGMHRCSNPVRDHGNRL